jgi:rubrerythrin
MNLEQAIRTAIAYEKEVRDIYDEGGRTVNDEYGRNFFRAMADDEQRHVDYLEHKLEQWRKNGRITVDELDSAVPSRSVIRRAVNKIGVQMNKDARGMKEQQLSKALQVEIETSRFYRQMVAELSAEGRDLFAHFLEIEENHIEAVQFELDFISNTGYWFNIKEFDME